jgi:hypothetical protein
MLAPGSYTVIGSNNAEWRWRGTAVAQTEGEGVLIAESGQWMNHQGNNNAASRIIFFTKEKLVFRNGHTVHDYQCVPLDNADGLQGTYACGPDAYSCTFAYDASRNLWRLKQTIVGPHKDQSLWWEYTPNPPAE